MPYSQHSAGTFPDTWNINAISWQEVGSDGTKYALLEGNRDTAGKLFTYAFFLPAGFWDPPHWHTTDARIIVMQGALHLAYNNDFAPKRAQVFEAGSILLVPACATHFDGATEDTLIIGVATGPWRTTYRDATHAGSAGTPTRSN